MQKGLHKLFRRSLTFFHFFAATKYSQQEKTGAKKGLDKIMHPKNEKRGFGSGPEKNF